MKFLNYLKTGALLSTGLLLVGCGGGGDATKVTKATYKKIVTELASPSETPKSLPDILKANNVTLEDYSAAATQFANDAAFMKEINEINLKGMGAEPAGGGSNDSGGTESSGSESGGETPTGSDSGIE